MRRISENNHLNATHPEANDWLTDFMIDLKTMKTEENYQPFTMERLSEWSTHRSDIESCWQFESSQFKRLSDNPVYEHASAIMHFNGLVIDLKLMVMGHEYDEITAERIREADGYYLEINRCRKNRRMFY